MFALCEKFLGGEISVLGNCTNFVPARPCEEPADRYRLPLAPSTERN